ncbi:MAG: DUF3618 domain-containing protein [Acidobacteriota bacterium]
MRDRQEIEREMFRAREDLEQNLDELKHTVREKVDLPARARAAVEEKKQQMKDLARRGADGAKQAAVRAGNGVKRGARASIDFTKERPVLVGGVFLGVVLGLIAAVVIVKRRNRPWYERWYDAISP